jgi:hypothetical protein
VTVTGVLAAGSFGRSSSRESLAIALEKAAGNGSNPGPGAVQYVEPWLSGCGRGCRGGYFDFIDRHAGEANPRSRLEVEGEIELADATRPSAPQGLDSVTLKQRILSGLAIEDLVTGLESRQLLVAVLAEEVRDGIGERHLLIGDPEVGSFEALLLVPPGDLGMTTPRPAIVGLHGHRQTAADFADHHLGRDLAKRGFYVLIPTFRFHDCRPSEARIALRLLENHRTLLGLKVYEALLMTRILASMEEVDRGRIGILSHSGGSSVADLAVRISNRFSAVVLDLRVNFRDRCGVLGAHCQTVPALDQIAADLYREEGPPVLKVPYKFEATAVRAQILTFFETALDTK